MAGLSSNAWKPAGVFQYMPEWPGDCINIHPICRPERCIASYDTQATRWRLRIWGSPDRQFILVGSKGVLSIVLTSGQIEEACFKRPCAKIDIVLNLASLS